MTKYVVYNPSITTDERYYRRAYPQGCMSAVVRDDATWFGTLDEARAVAENLGFAYEAVELSRNTKYVLRCANPIKGSEYVLITECGGRWPCQKKHATRFDSRAEAASARANKYEQIEEINVSENNKMSIKGYVVQFDATKRFLHLTSEGTHCTVTSESEATLFAFRQQAERALGPGSRIVEITRPEPAAEVPAGQFVIYNPVVGGYFSTVATHYYSDQLSDAIRYNKRESAEAACLTGEVVKALVLSVRDV